MSSRRKQFLMVSLILAFFVLIDGSGVRAEERPDPTKINFGYYDTVSVVGTTVKIPAFVIPNHGEVYADQTLVWYSSDEDIATVSQYGYVTGKSPGTVTITAVAVNGISNETEITFCEEQSWIPIYRLYLPQTGEHLYTPDRNEYITLFRECGWGQEGIAWYAPKSGAAVYRLYHPGLKNHLYTTDTHEVTVLTEKYGWQEDNDGKALFYSEGAVPIYRVYHKEINGMHHLTADLNEYSRLRAYGWRQEGHKFNAVKLGEPYSRTVFYK